MDNLWLGVDKSASDMDGGGHMQCGTWSSYLVAEERASCHPFPLEQADLSIPGHKLCIPPRSAEMRTKWPGNLECPQSEGDEVDDAARLWTFIEGFVKRVLFRSFCSENGNFFASILYLK